MRRSSSARKPRSSRAKTRAASRASALHVMQARLFLSGRIAKGPPGRKCWIATPPCGSLNWTVATIPHLIVRPADGFDAGRFAQLRIPAVRRNAKRRTDRTLIAKPNFRSTLGKHQAIGLGRRNPDDRRFVRDRLVKCRAQRCGGHHVGCRLTIRCVRVIRQPCRPHAILQGRIRNLDRGHRLGFAGDRLPNAEAFENGLGSGPDRKSPPVSRGRGRTAHAIDDRNAQIRAERLH